MAGTRPVALGATTQRCREGHQRPLRTRRTPAERRRLEQALEAALSVVEAAVTLLDAMDGDADLEPACEDEGHDSDSEPDTDLQSLRWVPARTGTAARHGRSRTQGARPSSASRMGARLPTCGQHALG